MSLGRARRRGAIFDNGDANNSAVEDPIDSALVELASDALPTQYLERSAKTGLTRNQSQTIARAFCIIGLLAHFLPGILILDAIMLGAIVFTGIVVLRLFLVPVGASLRLTRAWRPAKPRRPDSELPIYTILAPFYRDAETIAAFARAMNALDYPEHLIDLKLQIETGDDETLRAISGEVWPSETKVLTLPPGAPQTKPRALNFGLHQAKGAITTIYDAEDRPHPNQLRAALDAFETGGPRCACLQAPLRAHNRKESWIASQWSLEYAIHFGLVVPALTALRLPVPLGGTSNHFNTTILRAAGGWGARNVTEDADLGLRLAREGHHIAAIAEPTLEEAPVSLGVWAAQRSRRIKGHMQTWLVVMRDGKAARRELGLAGFVSTQMIFGGAVLAALCHGPIMLVCLALLVSGTMSLDLAGAAFLASGYAVSALGAALAPFRCDRYRLFAVLTMPLYWPLHSLAAARAVYGLIKAPHFWAKTPHGLTRRVPSPTLSAFAE